MSIKFPISPGYAPLSIPLARIAEENRPLIFQDDAKKSFETLILMAHKAYHAKKNNHRLLVESLAEGPYCNDHLRRRFKKSTGQTPGEYLTNLRIEYAKKLMNENNMLRYSIAEICVMSGYYDSHYFSRIFKKKTGMTPAEYMKQAFSAKGSGPS